jgi:hypothetical protein
VFSFLPGGGCPDRLSPRSIWRVCMYTISIRIISMILDFHISQILSLQEVLWGAMISPKLKRLYVISIGSLLEVRVRFTPFTVIQAEQMHGYARAALLTFYHCGQHEKSALFAHNFQTFYVTTTKRLVKLRRLSPRTMQCCTGPTASRYLAYSALRGTPQGQDLSSY